ncbi:hypothetical protein PspLS_05808 [Pyricularia sp. CBS 133598]|nr:hypothetical protein PspLS_05808 [Pyricularia sp. CBS 133598]
MIWLHMIFFRGVQIKGGSELRRLEKEEAGGYFEAPNGESGWVQGIQPYYLSVDGLV